MTDDSDHPAAARSTRLVHQPNRLAILVLSSGKPDEPTSLAYGALSLSDGNLGRHLSVLGRSRDSSRRPRGSKATGPRTWATLTLRVEPPAPRSSTQCEPCYAECRPEPLLTGRGRSRECDNAQRERPAAAVASVRILGGVHAVASDGSLIDLPSASQRRLLAILALHSPRRLRSEWLADVLDISPGALRTSVSRVRATVGTAMLETASTGYALVGDVDAARFCRAVADAADADDRVRALQFALDQWNGPALEEFLGEEWADGEIARLTEIHAGTVDDLAESLIEARRPATRSHCSKPRSPATRTATARAGS